MPSIFPRHPLANLEPLDWHDHTTGIINRARNTLLLVTLSFLVCALLLHAFHLSQSLQSMLLLFLLPTLLSSVLMFRLRRFAMRDLYDISLHAERNRGLAAGNDKDGDGKITGDERVNESVEWLNALLRGVWVIGFIAVLLTIIVINLYSLPSANNQSRAVRPLVSPHPSFIPPTRLRALTNMYPTSQCQTDILRRFPWRS